MFANSLKSQFTVREARESDVAKVCEVLVRSVREICAPDYNNDEAVLQEWCANKKPEIVARWIRNADTFVVVAESSCGEIVGAAMFERAKGPVELCYIVPEALHQGIGSRLLKTLEVEAARLGHKEIHLVSSITARDFYRRNGYSDDGEQVYWGKVLGFPMRKVLTG
jgi:predicted N-acetyltransferase YhbS